MEQEIIYGFNNHIRTSLQIAILKLGFKISKGLNPKSDSEQT